MENISFDLYRLFYVVANSRTISEAADKMYITQPAVTQGIKKLEDQIGGNLFFRSNKGINLTEEGKRLYAYIEDGIEILENTHKTFKKYINLEEGKIRIKSGNMEEKIDIYENISRFMNDYPNIDVQIHDGPSYQSIEELVHGQTDLVILNLPYTNELDEKVVIKEIKNTELCLYCSEKYYKDNIKEKKQLSIKDLEKLDFIFATKESNTGRTIKKFFEKNNMEINARFYSPSAAERKFMAEESLGILFALKGTIDEKKLKKIEIKEKLPEIKIGIATLNDEIIGFATKELVKYIEGEK